MIFTVRHCAECNAEATQRVSEDGAGSRRCARDDGSSSDLLQRPADSFRLIFIAFHRQFKSRDTVSAAPTHVRGALERPSTRPHAAVGSGRGRGGSSGPKWREPASPSPTTEPPPIELHAEPDAKRPCRSTQGAGRANTRPRCPGAFFDTTLCCGRLRTRQRGWLASAGAGGRPHLIIARPSPAPRPDRSPPLDRRLRPPRRS